MDEAAIADLARRYVSHTIWWVRQGCADFTAHQQKVRDANAEGVFDEAARVAWLTAPENQLPAGPDDDAEDQTRDWLDAGGRRAWLLLREIVRAVPEDADDVLGYIGAGPFESWVSEARVGEVLAEIEAELASSTRFRFVASASWDMPPLLVDLLERFPPEPTDYARLARALCARLESARTAVAERAAALIGRFELGATAFPPLRRAVAMVLSTADELPQALAPAVRQRFEAIADDYRRCTLGLEDS